MPNIVKSRLWRMAKSPCKSEFHTPLRSFQQEPCWEMDVMSNANFALSSNNKDQLREINYHHHQYRWFCVGRETNYKSPNRLFVPSTHCSWSCWTYGQEHVFSNKVQYHVISLVTLWAEKKQSYTWIQYFVKTLILKSVLGRTFVWLHLSDLVSSTVWCTTTKR